MYLVPRTTFAILILSTGVILGSGCATKKYVKQTVDPVTNRVDQVAAQSNQQGQTLEATRKDVERNEQEISRTRETANAADQRAGEAMNAANSAGTKADQANGAVTQLREQLRSTIANIDDYKPASTVVVPFGFNKFALNDAGKAELDKLGQSKDQWKRYFIAVEGFTDRTGTANYNDALSRRRAEQVVKYLVAKYDIPVYRIHEIGLGEDKPADEGHGRAANMKNRRVEVTVYVADANAVAANTSAAR
jgi:outer membrane protein OmpA-like peptidoglycan-associated protein